MPIPVFVEIHFQDAQERTAYDTVRVDTDLADDYSNMAAVMGKVDTINTNAEILSAASVIKQRVIFDVERAFGAPNEFANVKNYAFVRLKDSVTQDDHYVRVYAPDMLLYDASEDGLLDPAFQAAFGLLNGAIVAPDTGNDLDFEYAQERVKKRGRRLA